MAVTRNIVPFGYNIETIHVMWVAALLCTVLYATYHVIYNVFLHPLAAFPGPFWARASLGFQLDEHIQADNGRSIAGGETVATFLAAVTFLLLKNPATYLKLQHEIRSNYSSLNEITAMSAQQLPYLQALMDGDAYVKEDLLKACTDLGFFYLDCRHVASGRIMKEVQDMYTLATSFYDLPQEEKSRWLVDRDHDEHLVMGYKPAGHGNGPVEGKKDGFEGLMLFEHPISKIDDPSSFPGPAVIANELDPLKQAMSSFREMSILLLTRISEALELKDNLAYQQYHRKNAVCPTALGLLKYTLAEVENDKVGQIAHSDAGSLSIVFTEVAGLQVLKPNEETWYYIAPKPGHAVVNVGDALRFISGGVLESSLHRIIPHKDEMGRHKYSIVYLLRPEMDAEFVDAEGIVWKGLDWTNKKHAVFRASAEEQAKGTYLTGRDGYVGHWDPEKDAESQTITVR
ncbi:2-oxoglutarate-dependent dioxygenase gloE [Colletotrichum fructicola]|nr:2-oxoglutarate-dependent dioxygenase gloE [Colletotrichum fructicola]